MFKWLWSKGKKSIDSATKIFYLEKQVKNLQNQLSKFKNQNFKEKYQSLNFKNYKEFESDLINLISDDYQILLNNLLDKNLKDYEEEFKNNSQIILSNVLTDTVLNYNFKNFYNDPNQKGNMLSYYIDIKEYAGTNVDLEKVVGRFFGKGWSNKKFYKNNMNVEVELSGSNKNLIKVTSNNFLDLEIGKIFIKKLLKKQWNRSYEGNGSFESRLKKIKKDFDQSLINDGSRILKEYLEYDNFDFSLAKIIGKMQYRFSYGQNLLEHSLECAEYARELAKNMGWNTLKAKRAAFFHDIGKTASNEDDHIIEGLKIAKKFNLDDYILFAIKNHHNKLNLKNSDLTPDNKYTMLVKKMDLLSASRPGARIENSSDHFNNIRRKIHSLLTSQNWIKKVEIDHGISNLHIEINPSIDFIPDNINWYKKEIREILKKENIDFKRKFNIEIYFNFNFVND